MHAVRLPDQGLLSFWSCQAVLTGLLTPIHECIFYMTCKTEAKQVSSIVHIQ